MSSFPLDSIIYQKDKTLASPIVTIQFIHLDQIINILKGKLISIINTLIINLNKNSTFPYCFYYHAAIVLDHITNLFQELEIETITLQGTTETDTRHGTVYQT